MDSTKLQKLTIKNRSYPLPIYLPDATLGVVRGLSCTDLAKIGIEGVVINTYHLKDHPGIEILNQVGGIKKLMNFTGLAASDSGGFQLYSLIHKNPNLGKITDDGVILYSGIKKQKKILFTPEDSIKVQFAIKSDIMITLDDFTPNLANEQRTKESVTRTINWAKRCKQEFVRQIEIHQLDDDHRPLLFAPIQGYNYLPMRKHCAQELLNIGFDGYGLGGWPFKPDGSFDYEMCAYNATLTPDDKPRFALGVGSPENIVKLYQMGYTIFDCVLPTRDARHKRLYVFTKKPLEIDFEKDKKWYEYVYIGKAKYATDFTPPSEFCDCETCKNYSKAYLHHLFSVKDTLSYRLATIHNLRFYSQLISVLRKIKV